MKAKLSAVFSSRQLRSLSAPIRVGVVAAATLGVTISAWSYSTSWIANGQTVSAAQLKQNLDEIQTRLVALEAPSIVEATSDAPNWGSQGQDFVHPSLFLDLQPGTWLIQAHATVNTLYNTDAVALALYNGTTATEVTASRGGVDNTNDGAVALTTSKAVTITSPTRFYIKGIRNGASAVYFGFGGNITGHHRMSAVRIR